MRICKYGVPVVVTLNSFVTDTEAETSYVEEFCRERLRFRAVRGLGERWRGAAWPLAQKILDTLERKGEPFQAPL